MAQIRVKRGIKEVILLEMAYLNAIVRADSAQHLGSLSTIPCKIPFDKTQDIHHLGNVALNQSSDVTLDLAMP
jgi:hypothetical protein